MYLQRCVKGIVGELHGGDGLTQHDAEQIILASEGLRSNWWRQKGKITYPEIELELTDHNLDRHLHDYARFGPQTPFISLACGSVERDAIARTNYTYSAIDTALMFATEDWLRSGALFYCWVPTSHNKVVSVASVAEPVRDLNIYRRWSPYQLEGEITAKIGIPANQIEKVEWWDPNYSKQRPRKTVDNPNFVDPSPLSNIRDLF